MSETPSLDLHDGNVDKLIQYPGPDSDQSMQNLIISGLNHAPFIH